MSQVLVGLSGGLDSFVTALLLQQQGYEVIGAHLCLLDETYPSQTGALERLCDCLNIPLYMVEGRDMFRDLVIRPFTEGYLNGITPNPCASCNSFIKWNLLSAEAGRLGIPEIATGHYVRKAEISGHHCFRQGKDPGKDQSYFLWGVPEEIIRRSLTPLGDYTKEEVKAIARENGFAPLAAQRESMGICFLKGENYRDYLLRGIPSPLLNQPGEIVTTDLQKVGEHEGLLHYTIGQKKGLPLLNGKTTYVIRIDRKENRLIVGPKEALFTREVLIGNTRLLLPEEMLSGKISVKIRGIGLNPEGYAKISRHNDTQLRITPSSDAWAAAPGQPVALYLQDYLVGGGILC